MEQNILFKCGYTKLTPKIEIKQLIHGAYLPVRYNFFDMLKIAKNLLLIEFMFVRIPKKY